MEIFENPAALLGKRNFWIGVWLVGVVIFLTYYMGIGYMPDFEVSSLSFLLLVAAFVGLLFVVLISMFVLLPALVWKWTILGRKEYRAFLFGWENSKSISLWFGLPFVPTLAAGLAAFYLYFFRERPGFYVGVVFVAGLLISIVWLWIGLKQKRIVGWRFKGWYVGCWVFSWFMFIVPFTFIALIVGNVKVYFPEAEQATQLFFLGSLAVLAVMASVIALEPSLAPSFRSFPVKLRRIAQFMAVGGFFTLVLFLIPGTWHVFPKAVMRALGIGGDVPVTVVFSMEGGRVASLLGLIQEVPDGNAVPVSLLLRSRLGTEYVFTQKDSRFQYILPKAAVAGMSRELEDEKPGRSNSK